MDQRFQIGPRGDSPLGEVSGAAAPSAVGAENVPEQCHGVDTTGWGGEDDLRLGGVHREHCHRAARHHRQGHLPHPIRGPFGEYSSYDGATSPPCPGLLYPEGRSDLGQLSLRPLRPAALVLLVRAETLDSDREFLHPHRERPRQPLHQITLRAGMPKHAVAAEKADADLRAAPLLTEDQQRPHASRRDRMGPAAGGVVHAGHRDHPDGTLHGGLLPEREGGELLRGDEASLDRQRALNQVVDRPFDLGQHGVAEGRRGEVDGDVLRTEMKTHRPESVVRGEHGGEQMLAEMLLHVIETPRPVDRAGDRDCVRWEGRLEEVADSALIIHLDIENTGGIQVPVIRGLPTPLGVKSGSVENDGRVVLPHVLEENPGGEGGECRVGEVEAFRGHSAAVYLARLPATTPRQPWWRTMTAPSSEAKGAPASGFPGEPRIEGAGRMLSLVGMAELLGMSVWLAASVVAPELRDRWDLTAAQAGWLTSAVQLGFVGGTLLAAVLNLADLLPVRWYFAAGAVGAAAANLALLVVPGFPLAVLSRLVTGFCLAAVYPPAMKMVATWYRSGRGFAIGVVVGALTVGKATPYLVEALGGVGFRPVILATTAAAGLAAILVIVGYREGPYPFIRRAFSWSLVGEVVRVRGWRLTTAGYCGHMLELYACWTWLATFLGAGALAAGGMVSHRGVALATFGAIGIGGLACVWGGSVADRIGRERLVRGAMMASGACALLTGVAWFLGFGVLVVVAVVWGWFVIADSAQFSTLVTEQVPSHAVGTALTLQTSIGFAISTISIQAVPRMADWLGWQWSFGALALGPALGVLAIRRLQRSRPRP